MSATATKRPYREALAIAQAVLHQLEGACDRSMITGSIRRLKSEVGDIELVAIPKITETTNDMFGVSIPGSGRNLLNERLTELGVAVTKGVKEDAKFKQFVYEGMTVDLFLPTVETWGCVATIRTGSADYIHWLVTERRKGGGCYSHLKFKEGRIWDGAKALSTPEEIDVYQALEQPWIDPTERTDELAASFWRNR